MTRGLTRPAALVMVAWLALLPGTASAAAPSDSPLHITADNMTGSRGPRGDEVLLNRNVRITRDRTVITADRGRYLRADGMLFLEGNVRMVDSTIVVTCERASYSEPDDVIDLAGNVKVVDRNTVLTAPTATYDREFGIAELFGGVEARDSTQLVTSERARYFREERVLEARGTVRGIDQQNDLEIKADSVDYDRVTHEALATGNPSLTSFDADRGRTVIRALKLQLNTESGVAEAIDSVYVDRDTLRARADYGLFDDEAQRGWLLGSPRAWDEETTVSGDTLELWTAERKLERVVVRGNAVMDYIGIRPDTEGETSRLAGQRIDVFFTDESIDSLVAVGKARNRYDAKRQAGKTQEGNMAFGDTITVYFDRGKIDRALLLGSPTGEYRLPVAEADSSTAEDEVVRYQAPRIEYRVPSNKIILSSAASLTYGDLELSSDHVEFDVDRQTLVATGKPELMDRGDRVGGNLMTYDLDSRVGNIYEAETQYEKGLYQGKRIRKAEENQLDVMRGSFSTCSNPEPHYHFAAKYMKIYLKDKLVAKPVVFYIKKVPIFALPFWIFPIKPGRHSGFLLPQVEFGFSNAAGQFIRNAGYYWAPNDYMDLTVSGDYYQFEPSWVLRSQGNYKLLYVLDGYFRTTYARNEGRNTEDWDINANHSQQLSPRTRLIGRASFVSSRDFNSSNLFGRSLTQRFNRFLISSMALSHTADWASFNVVAERRQDLDADAGIADPDGDGPLRGPVPGTQASLANLSETLPSVSMVFPTRAIGSFGPLKGTPLEKSLSTMYFNLNGRFVSNRERRAFVSGYVPFVRDSVPDTTTVIAQQTKRRWGLGADFSLSDARRVLGWLSLRPSLTLTSALFDRDELGNKIVPAATWSSNMTASSTFYGTFFPRIGRLEGMRHVLFPSVAFNYSPEFEGLTFIDPTTGVKRNRFESFSGIGVSGFKRMNMTFGLSQRLQVKLKKGDDIQKLDNLLTMNTSGSYNFLYREQGLKRPLSTLNSNLFVQPPGLMSASFAWLTDLYSPRPLRSMNFNMNLDLRSSGRQRQADPALPLGDEDSYDEDEEFRDDWSLGLAYSYSGGYPGFGRWSSNSTANAVLRWKITPGWALDYSASYDITEGEMGTQQFTLGRDLHCWRATFTRTFAPDGEAEYYFRLGVKEQKEIFIERGTRGGSIGGIN